MHSNISERKRAESGAEVPVARGRQGRCRKGRPGGPERPAVPFPHEMPPVKTPFRRIVVPAILVLAASAAGCADMGTAPGLRKKDPTVLISSFEIQGSPSLDGWLVGDPARVSVVRDTPPGGGFWSVKLTSNGSPTSSYLYAPLNGLEAGDIIDVQCVIRAADPAGGGSVELRTGPTINGPWHRKVVSYDTLWTPVSFRDTVSLVPGETVGLVLSSLNTEVIRREGMFDLVSVTRIP